VKQFAKEMMIEGLYFKLVMTLQIFALKTFHGTCGLAILLTAGQDNHKWAYCYPGR